MKVLILMVLSFVFGAVAWHQYERWQSPPAPPVENPGQSIPAGADIAPTAAGPGPDAPVPAEDMRYPPPGVTPATTTPALPAASAGASSAAANAGLVLPVQGITRGQLLDTFTDARSEGRSHDAIDIMAPAGTPVLAVADGSIEKLFTSDRGGLTIYQFEPSGRLAYYYAHLQQYADGLAEKQAVRRGQVIGYVGSTGNANPEAPHLHFAIFLLGPERRWWEGQAINPYPVLQGTASP